MWEQDVNFFWKLMKEKKMREGGCMSKGEWIHGRLAGKQVRFGCFAVGGSWRVCGLWWFAVMGVKGRYTQGNNSWWLKPPSLFLLLLLRLSLHTLRRPTPDHNKHLTYTKASRHLSGSVWNLVSLNLPRQGDKTSWMCRPLTFTHFAIHFWQRVLPWPIASNLGTKPELSLQPVKTTMTKSVYQWLRVAPVLVLLKGSSVQRVWSESRQKENKSRMI